MKKTPSKTLHDKILGEISSNIISGEWAAGFRIPFETELAGQFGVSRMTVNKVLSQLTREGVLQRRRKLGTVVCAPKAESAVLEITDLEQEVSRLGQRYGYHLLSQEQRVISATERLGFPVAANSPVVALRCLHSGDGVPFCLEERVISVTAVPEAKDFDFSNEAPSHWLLRKVPWRSAKHLISALNAGPVLAKQLQMKVGAACLVVDRMTEFNGLYVTHVRLTYPGDKHQMVAQFSPRQA
jgi:GntR family transcriptional regulator, histidine utilization repressor